MIPRAVLGQSTRLELVFELAFEPGDQRILGVRDVPRILVQEALLREGHDERCDRIQCVRARLVPRHQLQQSAADAGEERLVRAVGNLNLLERTEQQRVVAELDPRRAEELGILTLELEPQPTGFRAQDHRAESAEGLVVDVAGGKAREHRPLQRRHRKLPLVERADRGTPAEARLEVRGVGLELDAPRMTFQRRLVSPELG